MDALHSIYILKTFAVHLARTDRSVAKNVGLPRAALSLTIAAVSHDEVNTY